MSKSIALRLAGFIGAAGLTAALVGSAVAGTGAYFNDSKPGTINASLGSIKVDTSNTALSFTNLLPGDSQTQTAQFTNTGLNPQDVWVVFNAADIGDGDSHTDAGLINDLGTYGEVLIKTSGTPVFSSNNLNDDSTTCPPGAGADLVPPRACAPLPHMIKLQQNLGVGASSDFAFTFTVAAKLKAAAAEGGPIFAPIRYTIVATQHDITPDNSLNTTPIP